MNVKFTDAEKKELKRMAALQLAECEDSSSTPKIYLWAEETPEEVEIPLSEYDEYKDDISTVEYDCVSFNSITALVAYHLEIGLLTPMESDIKKYNRKAEAEKRANEARVNSEREIARKNNELALEKAALKEREDTARARADAAYRIQSEEQRKVIDVTSAEADIAAQTKQVELKAREADVAEQELNARIKKQADANLYQRQQEAEAKKFEMQRAAEAEKYKREQEAEGIRLVGQAEADAIRQKGLAEAETMAKKAIAYQEYTGAAVAEMLINVLPQVAERIAQPLAAIDKVTIIGGGEGAGSGVGSVADGVPLVMGKLFASMKEATGIDLSEIVRAESYDAKVKKEVSVNGALPVTMAQNSAQEGEQLETHVEDATVQQD